jgi:RNA polymerase sigma factor (TIGR02999 family)
MAERKPVNEQAVVVAERSPQQVTGLLIDWSRGNQDAFEKLMPVIYEQLRELAHHYLGHERKAYTLQTTALVHEAYVKLVGQENVQWQGRAHFFRASAQAMRRILVDHARSLRTAKRDRGENVPIDEQVADSVPANVDLVSLDGVLEGLAKLDPRKASIVELRYFGGLTMEDIADVLGLSLATIKREWVLAKAWLYKELGGR